MMQFVDGWLCNICTFNTKKVVSNKKLACLVKKLNMYFLYFFTPKK
jgi:hypothetical protein